LKHLARLYAGSLVAAVIIGVGLLASYVFSHEKVLRGVLYAMILSLLYILGIIVLDLRRD
jgi:hypothetical protein